MWTIVAQGYQFLEAPRFDLDGNLWFSDLLGGGIRRLEPSGRLTAHLLGRKLIGGIVATNHGALVLGAPGGLWRYDPITGSEDLLLDTVDGRPLEHVNDIEADTTGRILGGTVDFASIFDHGTPPEPGILFRWSPLGGTELIREDLRVSNGLGFSPDGVYLYHSDSGTGIFRYGYTSGDALALHRELIIPLPDSDGLVVDMEGNVWVARWQAGVLARYLPDGKLDRSIGLPWQITSLTFGGRENRDLYVTCGAPKARSDGAALLRLTVDIPGVPACAARVV